MLTSAPTHNSEPKKTQHDNNISQCFWVIFRAQNHRGLVIKKCYVGPSNGLKQRVFVSHLVVYLFVVSLSVAFSLLLSLIWSSLSSCGLLCSHTHPLLEHTHTPLNTHTHSLFSLHSSLICLHSSIPLSSLLPFPLSLSSLLSHLSLLAFFSLPLPLSLFSRRSSCLLLNVSRIALPSRSLFVAVTARTQLVLEADILSSPPPHHLVHVAALRHPGFKRAVAQ